jgi:asperthecin polyketide synthase
VHHGLCHAPHIYSAVDVQAIIEDILDDDHARIAGLKTSLPLLSSSTGRPYPAKDFRSLIDQVLAELLMNKIHIDNVVDGIVEVLDLPSASQQERNLFAFRNSVILRTMMKNVEKECNGRMTFTHRDLVEWTKREESEAETPMSPKGSKLAVVGMSCRLPGGANDLELFWKLMAEKRDVHTTIPPDRFDLSTHFDPTGQIENTTQTPYMNHIESPGLFDAGFFNISPKEVKWRHAKNHAIQS